MDAFEYQAKFGAEDPRFNVEVKASITAQLSQEDYETLNGVFQTIGQLAFKYLEGGEK